MSLFRFFLLGLLGLLAAPLNAQISTYFVHDHQIRNFLVQKCNFDIDGEWQRFVNNSDQKSNGQLTKGSLQSLNKFKAKFKKAIQSCMKTKGSVPNVSLDQKFIDALLTKRFPDRVVHTFKNFQQQQQEVINNLNYLEQKFREVEALQGNTRVINNFNEKNINEFLQVIFDSYARCFSVKMLKLCDKDDECENIPAFGLLRLDHDSEQNSLQVSVFPNDLDDGNEVLSFARSQIDEDAEEVRSGYLHVLYEPFQGSHWKRNLTIGLLGITAVAGAYGIYSNWGNLSEAAQDLKDRVWDPNQCGDDVTAGPGCTRPWQIRCQDQDCGTEFLGPDSETWIVTGDCSFSQGCNTVALFGGKDINGYPHCRLDKALPENFGFIGQLAPNAWKCPAGKSPFHFLNDGRLCFYKTPVIRAGIDKAACDEAAEYCKLPGGLTLYRNGEDLLLTPPCGQGVKICKVGDLKLYLHEDGNYSEASVCHPVESGGVCVFDENTIEFWNHQTQSWQDKPVDWNQEQMMYRFNPRNGEEVKVFCNKDGSCTIQFPCRLDQGICPVDGTVFYSKKGSGVWTEGMPCDSGDAYCILQNEAVFYPHVNQEGVAWKHVPAWTGKSETGLYQGPDGQLFIPNKHCNAWVPFSDGGLCLIDKDTQALSFCDQDGIVSYWHTNQEGLCGWNNAPMCTGNERNGICVGPDGRVFILNDDLSEWIPEPVSCKHETALFCVNEDGAAKYWHRGAEEGQSGSWHNVPDCKDFGGKDFCVGPDKALFELNKENQFTRVMPIDQSKSELRLFENDFAVWDPSQQEWVINNAPCSKTIIHEGRFSKSEATRKCCVLDDGNTLYQHVDEQGSGSWHLAPQVTADVNVYQCDDQTKRWRQIPDNADQWKPVMPCPDSNKKYVVPYSVYNDAIKKQQDGRAKLEVELDVCENVLIDNLHAHCIDCKTHSN